jgi:Ca-activated chloride channel family protein
MFRFEHPHNLYWFIIFIPIIIFQAWTIYIKRKNKMLLGDSVLVAKLMESFSMKKYIAKQILIVLAIASLIMALANPQLGNRIEKVKRKGIDVMVALDVSNSMMAEDIKPNRMERAKQVINRLLEKLTNDRIGLIVFAGKAYLQMPITVDYSAARLYLQNVSTGMVPTQGTAIGAAIELANESFQTKEKKYKALVLITDGENHEDDAIDAAKIAAEAGVKIFTIGVGTAAGAPIPVYNSGTIVDFKKDEQGSIVLSKLNEDALIEISKAANGNYFHLGAANSSIDLFINDIEKLEGKVLEEKVFTDYEDYFQVFLFIALILLIIEFLIFETKTYWLKYLKWVLPVLLINILSGNAQSRTSYFNFEPERKLARLGITFRLDKNDEAAITMYDSALRINPKFTEAYFNMALSFYGQKKYDTTISTFHKAIATTTDKNIKAKAYYNIGNTYLEKREPRKAITAYRESLKNNWQDYNTKYNLAYANALLAKENAEKNKNNKGKPPKPPKPPTPYALAIKATADEMIQQGNFSGAAAILREGLAKDSTLANFKEFMNKVDQIIPIQ